MKRTNANAFMEEHFPEFSQYKRVVSRMWERKFDRRYLDDWWFKFGFDDLSENEFIIFVGAKDYSDIDFKVFKVPTSYISENLDNISMTKTGWINLYIHVRTFTDIRNPVGVPFGQFSVN